MQQAAWRTVREFVSRSEHRDRVARAAHVIVHTHSDASRRLGERATRSNFSTRLVGLAIALLGNPAPTREIGLLGSAVARPQTTAFGEDAYPDIGTKADAPLHSIVKHHALVDGNKRLGWLAAAVFLKVNGIEI